MGFSRQEYWSGLPFPPPRDISIRLTIWASLVAQMVKNPLADAEDVGSTPELGRSLGGGNGNPLQYSCLGNPKDRGAWWIQSTGLQRVRQDLVTEHAHAFLKRLSLLLILILLPLRNGTMGMGIVSITGLLLLLLLLLLFFT